MSRRLLDVHTDAMTQPCRHCGAKIGRPCRWPDGAQRKTPHVTRIPVATAATGAAAAVTAPAGPQWRDPSEPIHPNNHSEETA